ncbi:DUF2780 domain-containing protein [Colwellia sp. M166]|uniref:DUF2780 domain-containing protein n=1 Tax=Colwellia sp. M166 TaxID=2583805 RepID=UPI00211E5E1B|nr:DUF2780 domain-containing protein [Colwellia sp. M166]UUO25316.1 DUF2780 domain-containing protein [Colwellia sp. M166]|tara:strand:+ start:17982 stop:18551 length:570 start_codon:yes stop_codon:yes gene_type:complete
MKKLIVLLTISTLSTSAIAQETSWFDSLKNLVGLGDKTEQTVEAKTSTIPNTDGLVNMLTSSLDVNADQASGGMGAIFNYVKNNVSVEQFSQLAKAVPGVEGLIGQMPDTSKLDSGSDSSAGLGGLLDKASQYSDSLKSINKVKKQFEALGLKPEMITSFISTAQTYLDTEQGQQAKQVLTAGLGKLLG